MSKCGQRIYSGAEDLRKVLNDKIQNINGIQRTETFISLHENINRPIQVIKDGTDEEDDDEM